MGGEALSRKATAMLNAFDILAPDIQDAAVTVVRAMGEGVGARSPGDPVMNDGRRPYLASEG